MSSKTDGSEGQSAKRARTDGSEGRSAKLAKTGGSGGLALGSQHSKLTRNYYDTFRFEPRQEDKAMFSKYVVQYYIQRWGQNLFMEEHAGYIVVRFVDGDAARRAVQKYQDEMPPPPFHMRAIPSIKLDDGIGVISPGTVTMYHAPRDLGHHDATTSLPRGWNNPFPIEFHPPPTKDTTDAHDDSAPSRPPRFKPVYPKPAQPEPPSPRPPFNQPVWPPLPGTETRGDEGGA